MRTIIIFILFILFIFPPLAFSAEGISQLSIVNTPLHTSAQQETSQDEITRISEIKATIIKVNGSVNVRSRGSLFWHDPRPGDFLRTGDEISTKDNGKLEFRLENGNVIKLKPNSHLLIAKMTQNNLTGEYENFFESNKGRLWSKIEDIEGDSTFRIKTPTAIAGARGTIIYLDIMPHLTTVLFQGGSGFFTNTISGETFDNVPPDNTSQSDSDGNLSEPSAPSEDQLQDMTGGWDFDVGAEGYSPPDDVDDIRQDVDTPNTAPPDSRPISDPLAPPTFSDIPPPVLVPPDNDGDGIPDDLDPDDDNDGLSDKIEKEYGIDPLDNDSDEDGLTDGFEALLYINPLNKDTDGDGIPDGDEIKNGLSEHDWDTDDDGANDTEEMNENTNPHLSYSFPHGLTYDEDLDGEPNKEDWDADDDGLANVTEERLGLNPLRKDTDGNGVSDRDEVIGDVEEGLDTDGDGLDDISELMAGTDPNAEDTDGDGLNDYEELGEWGEDEDEEEGNGYRSNPLVKDSDRDGVSDYDEANAKEPTNPNHPLYYPEGFNNDIDADGIPGEWDWDKDGDGISDDMERFLGTDPLKKDTDGNGIDDGVEIGGGIDRYVKDTDGDGIPDQLEIEAGRFEPNKPDTDGDGLNDGIEAAAGLSPFDKDTDGDGLEDGWEAFNNLDPFTPDMDNDGLRDNEEVELGTEPDDWDSDSDNLGDGAEIREGSDPNLYDTDSDAYGYFDGSDREDAFPNSPGGINEDGESYLTDDPAAYGSRNQMRAKRQEMIEEARSLRREISDMLSDMSARYNDSVMERIADAQTGKVMKDAHGYRVRAEQYVLRPNDKTVEVLNITLRTQEAGGLSGLHTLSWKTTFNKPLDGLTGGQLRSLPWGDYLEGSIGEDDRVTGGPNYGSTEPEYYPTEMSVKMGNPSGDMFNEKRGFGTLYSGSDWRQDISTDQIYVDGAWRNFTISTNQSSGQGDGDGDGQGNPKGFTYNPDGGLPSRWNIRADFYVIGDGGAGRIDGMEGVRFDTIWEALGANLPAHPEIGENNLEISLDSQFGGNKNRKIDIIYIPWNRQHWRENHSWRRD